MRTDLTVLCPRCVARIPRAKRCTRCGSKHLYDLRDPKARAQGLAEVRKRGTRALRGRLGAPSSTALERLVFGYLRHGVLGITALTFLGVALESRSLTMAATAAILAFLVQAALIGAGFAVFGLYSLVASVVNALRALVKREPERERQEATALAVPILVAEPLLLPSSSEERFVGRVRVASPRDSLLRHERCAAFRLVGEGPHGAVDDAGGTDFEVIAEDGSVARIVLGEGAFDLPVARAPVTVRPDAELRAFLDARGIFPERGPVRLAEAVLVEGDLVEVEGRARAATESDGYRAARTVKVFEERPDAPLVVRKVEPPEP